MKVTLRKAKALQTSIYEAIQALPLNPAIELGEFDVASYSVDNAAKEIETAFGLREALWNATYNIRRKVASANETSGIDELLNLKALFASKQNDLKVLSSADVATDTDVINAKVAKIKTSSRTNEYGPRFETIRTGILTSARVEGFKKLLAINKKSRTKIDDQLLELNVKTEITLESDIVDLLTAQNIL